ncbi:MAG TPA: MFS transporter, partial [Halococcus sp.]|nr:MFS transporter [Halococcus sp.]
TNAAVFELVPKFVPEAVGGASGWISGIGGGGTLVILPIMGLFVDVYGEIGYARGFAVFVALSILCVGVAFALKVLVSESAESAAETPVH